MNRQKAVLLKLLSNNDCCSICGGKITEENSNLDHIIPASKGGANRLSNLLLVHKNCNHRKRNKILACQILHKRRPDEFFYLLKRLKKLH
jgi:5-methylcytosine-specific restriction endonuclease McrA